MYTFRAIRGLVKASLPTSRHSERRINLMSIYRFIKCRLSNDRKEICRRSVNIRIIKKLQPGEHQSLGPPMETIIIIFFDNIEINLYCRWYEHYLLLNSIISTISPDSDQASSPPGKLAGFERETTIKNRFSCAKEFPILMVDSQLLNWSEHTFSKTILSRSIFTVKASARQAPCSNPNRSNNPNDRFDSKYSICKASCYRDSSCLNYIEFSLLQMIESWIYEF